MSGAFEPHDAQNRSSGIMSFDSFAFDYVISASYTQKYINYVDAKKHIVQNKDGMSEKNVSSKFCLSLSTPL